MEELDDDDFTDLLNEGKFINYSVEKREYNWKQTVPEIEIEDLEDNPDLIYFNNENGEVNLDVEGPILGESNIYQENISDKAMEWMDKKLHGKRHMHPQLLTNGLFGNAHSGQIPIRISTHGHFPDITITREKRTVQGMQIYSPRPRTSMLKDQAKKFYNRLATFQPLMESLFRKDLDRLLPISDKKMAYEAIAKLISDFNIIVQNHMETLTKNSQMPLRVEYFMMWKGSQDGEGSVTFPHLLPQHNADDDKIPDNLFPHVVHVIKHSSLIDQMHDLIRTSWFPILRTFREKGSSNFDFTRLSSASKTAFLACIERMAAMFDCEKIPKPIHIASGIFGRNARFQESQMTVLGPHRVHLQKWESIFTGFLHGCDPRLIRMTSEPPQAAQATELDREDALFRQDSSMFAYHKALQLKKKIVIPRFFFQCYNRIYQYLQLAGRTNQQSSPLMDSPNFRGLAMADSEQQLQFMLRAAFVYISLYYKEQDFYFRKYLDRLCQRDRRVKDVFPNASHYPECPTTYSQMVALHPAIGYGFCTNNTGQSIRNGRIYTLQDFVYCIARGFDENEDMKNIPNSWIQSPSFRLVHMISQVMTSIVNALPENASNNQVIQTKKIFTLRRFFYYVVRKMAVLAEDDCPIVFRTHPGKP